jgi:hypothetical protein
MLPNIKYELRELENEFSQGPSTKASRYDYWKGTIKTEIDRIKQTFIQEVFSFEDERHLERYIQYHQQALIQLMDRSALLLPNAKEGDKYFYSSFNNAFEELLEFIERHFTKYFDQDARAPQGYVVRSRKDAKANIRKLQKSLALKHADEKLIDLMLHALVKIIDGRSAKSITYRKIMYSKEIQKELFLLIERQLAGAELNEELRQIIYYLNYNSTRVLTYHAHYFTSLLDNAEFRTEKIEKLSFELKKVTQAQVKPGISYHQDAPSLKSQLIDYLTVELEYQERLQKLSSNSSDPPSTNFMDGFKLKFDASVSQLAYLMKVFLETRLIANNNISQLMAFIVRFVVTRKSENISIGSLRSKFYNTESGTKESVRNMLATMIQYIDRS